jgi:hypothetical protein
MSTVFAVIFFTRRKPKPNPEELAKEFNDNESESSEQAKAQLHSDCIPVGELETNELHEMAALEPVGMELHTPRSGTMESPEEWPLPLSPLPLLFASMELRDERAGRSESPKHETYYNR